MNVLSAYILHTFSLFSRNTRKVLLVVLYSAVIFNINYTQQNENYGPSSFVHAYNLQFYFWSCGEIIKCDHANERENGLK